MERCGELAAIPTIRLDGRLICRAGHREHLLPRVGLGRPIALKYARDRTRLFLSGSGGAGSKRRRRIGWEGRGFAPPRLFPPLKELRK